MPFAGEPERRLDVHVGLSHGSPAQLEERALGVQAREPETEAVGPRGVDGQVEPAARGVIALGPDQHFDRRAEGVGIGRRTGRQRRLDLIGRLGRRLAAQHALGRRMDAGDRFVARVTGSAPLEARQAVVGQMAKRKLDPGQGQSLGLELQRPFGVRLTELVIDRLKRGRRPIRPAPGEGGAAEPDGGLRVARPGRPASRAPPAGGRGRPPRPG